jgi:ABC-type Mn2+/Zn2+ transport system permease subunit
MGCCNFIKRLLVALVFVAVFVAVIHMWVTTKKYVFSEKAISNIAKKHVINSSGEQWYILNVWE